MRVYMIMPIRFCSSIGYVGLFNSRYRDIKHVTNMAIRHVGVTASLKQHADFFRYLLLKCVDRWNVYFNHNTLSALRLRVNTLLIDPLFFSL